MFDNLLYLCIGLNLFFKQNVTIIVFISFSSLFVFKKYPMYIIHGNKSNSTASKYKKKPADTMQASQLG